MRVVPYALTAVLVAVLAAGCSGGAGGTSSTSGKKGVQGSSFKITVRGDSAYWDATQNTTVILPGGGRVTSSSGGIDCGYAGGQMYKACSATFAYGTTGIAFTATPDGNAGYGYWAWAGACGGWAGCSVDATSDRLVVVRFAKTAAGLGAHPNLSDPFLHSAAYSAGVARAAGSMPCLDCHGQSLQGMGLAVGCGACHNSADVAAFVEALSTTTPVPPLPLVGAYTPPSTFYGDGASYGAGGWYTAAGAGSSAGQCLMCHDGGVASDMTPYLLTGHKNMLRKVTRGQVWATSDGTLESSYISTDASPYSLYASGSTYDWVNAVIAFGSGPNNVNIGGLGTLDPALGTTSQIVYQFGGWIDPTALDVVFRGGFTGEQWPAGNYDCGRCHTTGYRWDDGGPEPSDSTGTKIPATDFSRIPTDFLCSDGTSPSYAACVANAGTALTASWQQDGITCERCHDAVGHATTGDMTKVTKPVAEAATALCLQCHREENVDQTNNLFTFGACSDLTSLDPGTCAAIPGNDWVTDLVVYDGGSCSDGVTAGYAACVAISGNTWAYAPFFDHESGPTFLNSPHARFDGSIALGGQNQTDMTLVLTGAYGSAFMDPATGQNGGCTKCHDPHQSLVPAVGARPFVRACLDCHVSYVTNHSTAAGTPFDVAGGDPNATCWQCHMPGSYHLMRISVDPAYRTFPPEAQIAAGPVAGGTIPNSATDGKLANAVWNDLDMACGQCHVGSGYLFASPSVPGITLSNAALAARATCIHGKPVVHASAGPNGSVSPAGTVYLASGASQPFTFTAASGYRVLSVTLDGAPLAGVGGGASATYTLQNVTGCHHLSVAFGP